MAEKSTAASLVQCALSDELWHEVMECSCCLMNIQAALLAEMQDVRGSASFENCGTEFQYFRCIRQGGVEAPVLWGAHCQIRAVEIGGEVASQRLGVILRRAA